MDRDYAKTITTLRANGWTRTPASIEELVTVINALDKLFGGLGAIPYEYSATITHSLILDLCRRVIALEQAVRGDI